jgi:Flp pilus assembly protein TadG
MDAMETRRRQRRGRGSLRERGQAVTELALLLPLMLIIIVGVVEVNNAMSAYITVVSSGRDGARLGSKGGATTAQIQALVQKDLARLPNTTPTTNITVTYPTVSGMTAVKVRTCYNHTTLMQVPLILPNSYTICSQTTMPKLN